MGKLLLVLYLSIFVSCSYKTIPLKGEYQTGPYIQSTTTSIDKVWDKLVDLFATKGLSIKVIDKSSGLIVSDKYKLSVTQENKSGKLINPNAYVVSVKLYNPGSRTYLPINTTVGEWNVRIKPDGNGGTIINVNLVNIQEVWTDSKGYSKDVVSTAKSTGVFEKIIFDTIK